MEQLSWLRIEEIQKYAAELLSPEIASRIPERLSYLFRIYFKVNGLKMFEIMISTLKDFQNTIEQAIESEASNQRDQSGNSNSIVLNKDENTYIDKYNISNLTYEEKIERLHKVYKYDRYQLYGKLVFNRWDREPKAIGDITIGEVTQALKFVEDFEQSIKSNLDKQQNTTDYQQGLLPNPDYHVNNDFKIAEERLKLFAGKNLRKEEIMTSIDYKRLISYVAFMIANEKLPTDIEPISQTGLTNQFIRYTFYLIHRDLYTNVRIREYFIDFIHTVFKQFNGADRKTIKTKFSTPVQSYEADVEKMSKL